MGLRQDIQTDLADAFDNDLADAVKTISLVKETLNYNVDTGINTPIEVAYLTRGVLDAYVQRDLFDTAIEPGDIKAIILANEVAATPEISDYILHGTLKYRIIKVMSDPADAHWELLCRL